MNFHFTSHPDTVVQTTIIQSLRHMNFDPLGIHQYGGRAEESRAFSSTLKFQVLYSSRLGQRGEQTRYCDNTAVQAAGIAYQGQRRLRYIVCMVSVNLRYDKQDTIQLFDHVDQRRGYCLPSVYAGDSSVCLTCSITA